MPRLQDFRNIALTSLLITIVGCGGSEKTSLEFDLPMPENTEVHESEIEATFSVDGEPCDVNLDENSVDCGLLSVAQHEYELIFYDRDTQTVLARSSGHFEVQQGKKTTVRPTLETNIDDNNDGISNLDEFKLDFNSRWGDMSWGRSEWETRADEP